MGTIPNTTFIVTCPECNATESVTIVNRSSDYTGPVWPKGALLKEFDVLWSGGGCIEPEIVSAKCKKCGIRAEI